MTSPIAVMERERFAHRHCRQPSFSTSHQADTFPVFSVAFLAISRAYRSALRDYSSERVLNCAPITDSGVSSEILTATLAMPKSSCAPWRVAVIDAVDQRTVEPDQHLARAGSAR